MDEIKISSKFMKSVISKLIKMILRKKFGVDIDFRIEGFGVTVSDDKAHMYLNAGADMKKDELTKILKMTGLD